MLTIKNGEEKTFSFKLGGSVSTASLGTPTIVVSQSGNTYPLTIESVTSDTIVATLPSSISTILIPNLETALQLSWNDGGGNILIYPEQPLEVQEAYVSVELDPVEATDPEPTPSIVIDDQDYSSEGQIIEEFTETTEQEPVQEEDANDDPFVEYEDDDGGIADFDDPIEDEEVEE